MKYLNRELSWIEFNKRVLSEAENQINPLLERLKFLSISSSNLDEFLMVRMAAVKGQIDAGVTQLSIDGFTPEQVFEQIIVETKSLIKKQQLCWQELKGQLYSNNVFFLQKEELTSYDLVWLEEYFIKNLYPILTPLAIDLAHPFPFINNLSLTLIMKFQTFDKSDFNCLIPIPESIERFIILPGKNLRILHIKDLIICFLNKFFPKYKLITYGTFRVIRDSDIEFNDESEDLVRSFENQLKQRRVGKVIFLEIQKYISDDLKRLIYKELGISENEAELIPDLPEISSLIQIANINIRELKWKEFHPRYPERLKETNNDCFLAIKKKEFIVHHPYESFDVVIQFLRQAARDPKVIVIKQTLYRTVKENSEIALALIEAAEKGKSVTAIVELKARFDEATNIKYSKDLEKAGVHVVYTFSNIKTHAKLSLVVRREKQALKVYTHIGTGNYHPDNAKIYADLSLFSCDEIVSRDVQKMFNVITGNSKVEDFENIFVSPINLKKSLIKFIDQEIKNHRNKKPSGIWLKCNSLVDKDIIDHLYMASSIGVKVELVVRGICCLKPNVEGLSENIKVKSIIGRFLEHSRIYCFANGAKIPSREAKVFISSADLMPRNFERRFEIMVPIKNKTVHRQVLDQIMVAYLNDTKQSWSMSNQGKYFRSASKRQESAHEYFMSNPSLSGRGKALIKNKPQEIKLQK
tara:strand:- start:2758 stop:4842 length:2085 start_codon:yes stop_codon:yes gene_type:complete